MTSVVIPNQIKIKAAEWLEAALGADLGEDIGKRKGDPAFTAAVGAIIGMLENNPNRRQSLLRTLKQSGREAAAVDFFTDDDTIRTFTKLGIAVPGLRHMSEALLAFTV